MEKCSKATPSEQSRGRRLVKGASVILITVKRLRQRHGATLSRVLVDSLEECYGLEPQAQEGKNEMNWAVPAGTYPLALRQLGTSHFDQDYTRRFGSLYKGMIEVAGVPQRSGIEIHTGNSGLDTQGCLLVGLEYFDYPPRGYGVKGSFWLTKSVLAFQWLYPKIARALAEPAGARVRFVDIPVAEPALAQEVPVA